MEIFVVWLAFSLIPAWIASTRGRRWGFWLFISIITTPLLGLILVLMMPSLKAKAA
jgi:hypothetical protein